MCGRRQDPQPVVWSGYAAYRSQSSDPDRGTNSQSPPRALTCETIRLVSRLGTLE